jgi:hypothetical protein
MTVRSEYISFSFLDFSHSRKQIAWDSTQPKTSYLMHCQKRDFYVWFKKFFFRIFLSHLPLPSLTRFRFLSPQLKSVSSFSCFSMESLSKFSHSIYRMSAKRNGMNHSLCGKRVKKSCQRDYWMIFARFMLTYFGCFCCCCKIGTIGIVLCNHDMRALLIIPCYVFWKLMQKWDFKLSSCFARVEM